MKNAKIVEEPLVCKDASVSIAEFDYPDMIRMGRQSRTAHYIKSVFDLKVFSNVRTTGIQLLEITD